MKCNLCLSDNVAELGIAGFRGVSVTSDSKLCASAAVIFACNDCGHLQKIYSDNTLSVVDEVYKCYEAHNLSDGKEQLVFPEGSTPRPRTYHALEQCLPHLPGEGVLLDFGCGNGAVLKSAARLMPEWTIEAFDISDTFKQDILRLDNVANFYSHDMNALPCGKYDLIVLWHVLEHITDLQGLMEGLYEKLKDDGSMLVQVPDVVRNPFDLAVIDHVSHFHNSRLLELCGLTGFVPVLDGYNWFHNCNTLLLKKSKGKSGRQNRSDDMRTQFCFPALNRTVESFTHSVSGDKYVLFGTGMASIWLSGELPSAPAFFIDEDPSRNGKRINNIPVVTPDVFSVENIKIIIPLPRSAGEKIKKKLQKKNNFFKTYDFIMPELF